MTSNQLIRNMLPWNSRYKPAETKDRISRERFSKRSQPFDTDLLAENSDKFTGIFSKMFDFFTISQCYLILQENFENPNFCLVVKAISDFHNCRLTEIKNRSFTKTKIQILVAFLVFVESDNIERPWKIIKSLHDSWLKK